MPQLTDLERVALATLVVERGAVDPAAARTILDTGLPAGMSFVDWLMTQTSRGDVLQAIAAELNIPFVDFGAVDNPYSVADDLVDRVDLKVLREYLAIPVVDATTGRSLVATANPVNVNLVDYVRQRLGAVAGLALTSRSDVEQKLVFLEAAGIDSRAPASEIEDLVRAGTLPSQAQSRSAPLEWIDTTLERGAAERASDIHLTWDIRGRLHLKLRVDGMLRELPVPLNRTQMSEAIGALLAKCDGVDGTNRREPIDATFSFEAGGRRIDVRLAMLPQVNGPTVVLRLLDPAAVKGSLASRGLYPGHVTALESAVSQSQGMVIVTGPTGSGKSTTLYTLLGTVNATRRNVHTVEDPVEYRLDEINQTPIRHDLGERSITFARALRSILRLDPDVILVGEMRDLETAKVGLDAAITGHLVLSTLHANDAIQTFARLIEMKVPPYLVAEAITASVSQRLIRQVHQCAQERPPTPEEVHELGRHGYQADLVKQPTGCDGCAGSGFKGRRAVVEVLAPNRAMREAVASGASVGQLNDVAFQNGFRPMMTDGMRLVAEGHTTVREIQRVLVDTEENA